MPRSEPPPPLDEAELQRILDRLSGLLNDPAVVVIGGSALTIWHAQLSAAPPDPHSATSDLDLQGSADAVKRASTLLGGSFKTADFDDHTPQSGGVAYVDSTGTERFLDFLQAPYGLRAGDVSEHAVPLALNTGDLVYVMSPLDCLRSRLANFGLPGRDLVHAKAQLRAAIDLVPRFALERLNNGYPVREALATNEAVYKLAIHDHHALKLALVEGIDVAAAAIKDPRLPLPYRDVRLPQLQVQLASERERMARAWHIDMPAAGAPRDSPPPAELSHLERQRRCEPGQASDLGR